MNICMDEGTAMNFPAGWQSQERICIQIGRAIPHGTHIHVALTELKAVFVCFRDAGAQYIQGHVAAAVGATESQIGQRNGWVVSSPPNNINMLPLETDVSAWA